jgi:hypothetical protein
VNDWLKYGASAIKWAAGLLGGAAILAETKKWLQRRRMREQLYREMADNYERLANRRKIVTSLEGIKRLSAERFLHELNLRFTVHDHYANETNGPFFSLKEVTAISAIYSHFYDLNLMAQNDRDNGFEANQKAMRALAEFDKYLRVGHLNMKILEKVSHPNIYKYLCDVKQGKVESHEHDLSPFP